MQIRGFEKPPSSRYVHRGKGAKCERMSCVPFAHLDLDDGVYFPCWNPYGDDGWEQKNRPFIENVAMGCKPVCDSFINEDGTLMDADGTLAMERQILRDCEYVWKPECRQWKKPPSD